MNAPKKIKVFLYGKPMRDIYPFASRWQVFKYRLTVAIRKIFRISAALYALWLVGFLMGQYLHPGTTFAGQTTPDTLQLKITQLEAGVLTDLQAKCESIGYKPGDAAIVFDSNKRASIGPYQWQIKSVQHYAQALRGDTLSPAEAVTLATDYKAARQLARDVIFGTEKGLSNWENCTKKLNLASRVGFIKGLNQ